jgi:hypothetical protein
MVTKLVTSFSFEKKIQELNSLLLQKEIKYLPAYAAKSAKSYNSFQCWLVENFNFIYSFYKQTIFDVLFISFRSSKEFNSCIFFSKEKLVFKFFSNSKFCL